MTLTQWLAVAALALSVVACVCAILLLRDALAFRRSLRDLRRTLAQMDHRHHWRYSKQLTDGHPFWTWTCTAKDGSPSIADVCLAGGGGTNHRGGLPDHFPEALR